MRFFIYAIVTSILVCTVNAGCAGLFDANSPASVDAYASIEQMQIEAKKFPSPAWKIPLGRHIIDQMMPINDQYAVLILKNYQERLKKDRIACLNLASGKLQWDKDLEQDANDIVLQANTPDYIITATQYSEGALIEAFELRTGNLLWKKQIAKSHPYKLLQIDSKYVLLSQNISKELVAELINIKSGKTKWQYSYQENNSTIPHILVHQQGLLIAGRIIVNLNTQTGKIKWIKKDLFQSVTDAIPTLHNRDLYIITQGHKLTRLNINSGKIFWQRNIKQSLYITSISPKSNSLYLQGTIKRGNKIRPIISALNKTSGYQTWLTVLPDNNQLVSNLIEYKDKVFSASPSTLHAIKKNNGKIVFSKTIEKGQTSLYPVILRKINDKIIFIGETNIGAYKMSNGAYIYRRGITSISPEANLSALDKSVARLKKKIEIKNSREEVHPGYSSAANKYYQNIQASADKHYRIYEEARTFADTSKANKEYMAYRIDKTFARSASAIAFYEAAINFNISFYHSLIDSIDNDFLARHILIRNSIMSSYPAMMTENYVYRPSRSLNLTEPDAAEFLQITTINLQSGKKTRTSMSVPYRDYGLWIHLDEKRKLIYQQSIGLDITNDSDPQSYFIAKPVTLPN